MLGVDAGLDPLRQVDLLGGVEQRRAADLVEVVADRVGRNAGLVAVEIGLVSLDGVDGVGGVGDGVNAYASVDRELGMYVSVADDLKIIRGWPSRCLLAVTRSDGGLLHRGVSA